MVAEDVIRRELMGDKRIIFLPGKMFAAARSKRLLSLAKRVSPWNPFSQSQSFIFGHLFHPGAGS